MDSGKTGIKIQMKKRAVASLYSFRYWVRAFSQHVTFLSQETRCDCLSLRHPVAINFASIEEVKVRVGSGADFGGSACFLRSLLLGWHGPGSHLAALVDKTKAQDVCENHQPMCSLF